MTSLWRHHAFIGRTEGCSLRGNTGIPVKNKFDNEYNWLPKEDKNTQKALYFFLTFNTLKPLICVHNLFSCRKGARKLIVHVKSLFSSKKILGRESLNIILGEKLIGSKSISIRGLH